MGALLVGFFWKLEGMLCLFSGWILIFEILDDMFLIRRGDVEGLLRLVICRCFRNVILNFICYEVGFEIGRLVGVGSFDYF